MGQYPVINISLKEIDGDNFIEACAKLFTLLTELYDSFNFLLKSSKLGERDKQILNKLLTVNDLPSLQDFITEKKLMPSACLPTV